MATGAESTDKSALLQEVRNLRTKWNQSTPLVRQGADPLSGRFMAALERLITGSPDAFKGTELDVDANRERMEKLIAKVEGFTAAEAAPAEQLLAGAGRQCSAKRWRRTPSAAARAKSRSGKRWRKTSARHSRRGAVSAPCPATPAASSQTASTRR